MTAQRPGNGHTATKSRTCCDNTRKRQLLCLERPWRLSLVSFSFSTDPDAAAFEQFCLIQVEGFDFVKIIRNGETIKATPVFSLTLIDVFNDENGSDQSAAPLGMINGIFKYVCPDTVYQNKHMLSYCLQPESLPSLFLGFSLFLLFFFLQWFSLVGSVGCFCSQVSISSSMLS